MSEKPQPGGIVISGGDVTIGAVAQGPHAHASYKDVHSPDDQISGEQREILVGLVQYLLATLQQHGTELPDHEAIQAAADDVSAELDQEHPDRSRIRRLLTSVATAAGSITEIAAAVAAVQRAIGGMLSAIGRSPGLMVRCAVPDPRIPTSATIWP